MNAQSKHWFSLDTEREYMPSKNLTCPICGDKLTPPTPHSCNWAGGIGVTDEENRETIGALEPEPDYPVIDEVAWEETAEANNRTAYLKAFFAGMTTDSYNDWLDAQSDELAFRSDYRGW